MNSYEIKQQERKERLEARAKKARLNGNELFEKGMNRLKAIPLGQPILVYHYSARADRNYRAKSGAMCDKGIKELEKADYYEKRAEAVGTGGVSSDDPEAVKKLKAKLENLEKSQEMMKTINKILKEKLSDEEKAEKIKGLYPVTDVQIQGFMTPDYMGRIGFPNYSLTNNNANIRSTKKRIESLLKKQEVTEPNSAAGDGWQMKEDLEENRICFIFPGKPSEEIRSILKGRGFKWSPSRGAWVRMLNANGQYAAKMVINALNNLQ